MNESNGYMNRWAASGEAASRIQARLEEGFNRDIPFLIPLDAGMTADALLGKDKGLRGGSWLAAAEYLIKKSEKDYGVLKTVPGDALDLQNIENDAAESIEEIRRRIPGINIVVIHQHRFVSALLDRNDPLHDEMRAAAFGEEEPYMPLHGANIAYHGVRPRHEHHARIDASGNRDPDGRQWHILYLSSNLENAAGFYENDNSWLAGIPDVTPVPTRDTEAFIYHNNQHEIAHLLSMRSYENGYDSSDNHTVYLEECIADGAAMIRTFQKFGATRANEVLRTLKGARDTQAITACDSSHWTSGALTAAYIEAFNLDRNGELGDLDIAGITDIARRRVLGDGKGLPYVESSAEDKCWPALCRDDYDEFERQLAAFYDEESNWNGFDGNISLKRAAEGYLATRLEGIITPSEPAKAHLEYLDAKADGREVAGRAAPIIEKIAAGNILLLQAGAAAHKEDSTDLALEGLEKLARGY